MTRKQPPTAPEIPVGNLPHCVPCRQERDRTFNGRALTSRPDPTLPRAEAYVRVRGTTGLYRHSCRACLARTGDTVISWFREVTS